MREAEKKKRLVVALAVLAAAMGALIVIFGGN